METKLDFWGWLAVMVSVVALTMWACASVLTPDSAGIAWCAGAVVVIAVGSVGVRAWLKARKVVWTPELREAQRRRAVQQGWELVPLGLFVVGTRVLHWLVNAGVLPPWAGALLPLFIAAGCIWLWLVIRRRGTSGQPR
jgi:hypothetical protein